MYRLLIAMLTLFLFACGSDNEENEVLSGFNFPSDCCNRGVSMKALEGLLNESKVRVYSPNIITPNYVEGYNNTFFPATNDKVKSVELLQIIDENNLVVFEKQNFEPNKPELGWKGEINGMNAEGKFHTIMHLRSTDESLIEVQSIICSMICRDKAEEYFDDGFSLENSQWPSQHDGAGGYDPVLTSGGIACF